MHNFTLGKKWNYLSIFTFILFIGSFPSFGQTCPTEDGTDNTQEFCYLDTVSQITSDGSETAVYQTSDNLNDTQPIPGDEVLTDGATYFVGTTSGDCERVPVSVTVNTVPAPTNTIFPNSNSFSISPCSATNFTADDLAGYFAATESGYEVEVYATEFGDATAEGELVPGASYFIGQTPSSGAGCPSIRAAVGYDPNDPDAPVAEATQIFCEGSTVADLEATATYPNTQAIRWYRSETANSPLPEETVLLDGETYYASQVVNDRDSPFPPCESEERTAVLVELDEIDAGEQVGDGQYCLSEIQDRLADGATPEQLFLGLLAPEVPTDGTFADDSIAEISAAFNNNPIQTFTTTYTITNDLGCTDSVVLSITVSEDANAGEDTSLELCQSQIEEIIQLALTDPDAAQALLIEQIGEDVDTDGEFNNSSVQEIATQYFIAVQNNDFPFTASTTYTVGAGTECEDSSEINITVTEGLDSIDPITSILCVSEVEPGLDAAGVEAYYTGLIADLPQGGTFNPTPAELLADYQSNPIGTFTTTYTVPGGDEDCGGSVEVSVIINPLEDANAGEIADQTVCFSNDDIVLSSLLSDDASTGGTFSDENGEIEDGTFSPSTRGEGTYTLTYTVDDSAECTTEGTEATATFTITVTEGLDSIDPITSILCVSEVEPGLDAAGVEAYYTGLIADLPQGGTFNPTPAELLADYQSNPIGTFTTTYTVPGGDEDCGGSVEVSVTINPLEDANAGDIADQTVCFSNEDIVLSSLLSDDASTTGTFSDENGEIENGVFSPSTRGEGTYTITYSVDDSAECTTEGTEDTATFTITVTDGIDAIDPITSTLCISEVEPGLDAEGVEAYYTGLIADLPQGGTFNPTPAELLADYQSNPIGTFTTTYTVPGGDEDCGGSVEVSVTINPLEDANAGDIADQTVCFSNEDIVLSSLLNDDATTGGTFSDENGEIEDGTFSPSTRGEGTYTITYSVDDSAECTTEGTEDTATFTITVTEGLDSIDPITSILCVSEVEPGLDAAGVEAYYTGLIADLPQGGTFNPTPAELLADYQSNPIGTFTTTYTVPGGDEDCGGSVEVSVTINPLEDANAGDIADQTICLTQGIVDLSDYLTADATTGGTFSGDNVADGQFDPSTGVGEYTITYTVDDSADCVTEGTQDSTSFTITVTPTEDAEAGDIADQTICLTQGIVDLSDYLTADATTGGTFSGDNVADGQFDPSTGVGEYIISYTVDDSADCVTEGTEDSTSFVITVTESLDLGEEIATTLCAADIDPNLNAEGVEEYYNGLVDNLPQGGTFDPTPAEIFADYQANPIGTFTTTYTVPGDEDCGSSVEVSVTVTPTEDAEAGDIADQTVCLTQGIVDLSDYLTATTGGTFSGDNVADGQFDPSTGVGEYTITYTVDDSADCVNEGTEDSTSFTITVIDSEDAVAEATDAQINVCTSETSYDLFTALTENSTRGGSFFLNGEAYEGSTFDATSVEEGSYNFTYTVSSEDADCIVGEATASFTINVTTEAFDAGEDVNITACSANLNSNPSTSTVRDYFIGLLEDGLATNGTFSPGIQEIRESYLDNQIGTFSTTYTVGSGDCEDSVVLTVEVFQSANAGMDMNISVCSNDGVQNLSDFISEEANQDGEFSLDGEVIADATMNPADFEAGTYTVIYTVPAISDCGEDTAEFTVTVSAPSDAPEVTDQTFCAIDAPTVADLGFTQDGLTYYSDEAMTMMVEVDDFLEAGDYYITQTLEGECESDAAVINVTINDTDAPTITLTEELCESDDLRLSDLRENINETGDITWYTSAEGDDVLSENTVLEDGTTYYAGLLTEDSECESSERLAVTVQLETCELVFPEGISPNGDSMNETWYVDGIDIDYPDHSITIFNRWGNTVYKGKASQSNAWDGTSNQSGNLGDDVLPVGVYFYVIDFNDGERAPKQGKIYLSR
ncbi:gliding motility-associated C-terminal domain-containing protein [Autumnicola musiva]|uniref:Gliding motility-associated C-terminal domain-containing protein n=1 Tax=Autumnicola musiva TaxID=3075589 RepID=A0ABU3D281_9FLAO|nr:gliding motility-associated C-terminal domain-containing protein [Zunongwangia sp. F117]MDT0675638.1 gliding motility-associated C-terminal domain-containing protein [Zunongwangia sp. F117]